MAQEPGPHPEPNHRHQSPFSILILTGLSGSGKSTVLRALEDIGYFIRHRKRRKADVLREIEEAFEFEELKPYMKGAQK